MLHKSSSRGVTGQARDRLELKRSEHRGPERSSFFYRIRDSAHDSVSALRLLSQTETDAEGSQKSFLDSSAL